MADRELRHRFGKGRQLTVVDVGVGTRVDVGDERGLGLGYLPLGLFVLVGQVHFILVFISIGREGKI